MVFLISRNGLYLALQLLACKEVLGTGLWKSDFLHSLQCDLELNVAFFHKHAYKQFSLWSFMKFELDIRPLFHRHSNRCFWLCFNLARLQLIPSVISTVPLKSPARWRKQQSDSSVCDSQYPENRCQMKPLHHVLRNSLLWNASSDYALPIHGNRTCSRLKGTYL